MIKNLFLFFSKYFSIANFNHNHNEFKKIYPHELAVIFNSTYSNQINTFGIYNKDLIDKVLSLFKKNNLKTNIYLDIGSNIGDISLYFSQIFDNVICFEPHPMIFKILKFNTENQKNIEIFNLGVSENSSLMYQSKKFHNNFTAPLKEKSGENDYEIKTVSIDNFLKPEYFDLINLINITVDGSELEVLKGMDNLLNKNNIEILMIEADTLNRINQTSEFLKLKNFKYIYVIKESFELKKNNFLKIIFEKIFNKNRIFKFQLEENLDNKINFKFNKNILFSKKELFF